MDLPLEVPGRFLDPLWNKARTSSEAVQVDRGVQGDAVHVLPLSPVWELLAREGLSVVEEQQVGRLTWNGARGGDQARGRTGPLGETGGAPLCDGLPGTCREVNQRDGGGWEQVWVDGCKVRSKRGGAEREVRWREGPRL